MTMTATTRRHPTPYDTPTLGLWPDEEDVELPLDEELAEAEGSDLVRDTLVDALAACLSWAEGRTTPNAERVRFWRTLVGRPAVEGEAATPEARRDEGIARAAAKWTADEVLAVDLAIAAVAKRELEKAEATRAKVRAQGYSLTDEAFPGEFTTADVWAELDGRVPVTKGIAGRMLAAKAAGLIANTGRTVIAPRESTGPNHGQRLTVWRAL